MNQSIGSLVRARGREWVILPNEDDDILLLRPLGGTDADACAVFLPLERDDVVSAAFSPPDPASAGDGVSGELLRDAVRFQFRAGAGPFRCLGRLGVEPRPYQLVPLLMALKLSPIRLLIADDVGVGKTIEACLIARELLDRGEITRLAVVCPPHLCEQWQAELADKFHIDAEVVRPGTITRLERGLPGDQSVFDAYPFVVVSVDYIKAERRRADFVRACPEFVIVDEAHTCASGASISSSQQMRHQLLTDLAEDPERHLILVTATPHSGVAAAFRSLLGLLKPTFENLPEDLSGAGLQPQRRELARHFVQRRRGDVRGYLADSVFPERTGKEVTYRFTPEYHALFNKVLAYAREMILAAEGRSRFRQRVSWWAALGLLRCVASSPAAGALALTTRVAGGEEGSHTELEDAGRRAILDTDVADIGEMDDSVPAADAVDDEAPEAAERRRLRAMAREAEALRGDKDAKLKGIVTEVKALLDEGFHPIIFCRFIATAEYVAEELRARLRGVTVDAVTGRLAPEDRIGRVEELATADKRVLVATDCLSEGINLQQWFDAVVHYDLSWNPTRHEQREGRVDRYGQPRLKVRSVLYYGADNKIDGTILKVLLRKADAIRKDLGVSVPVPVDSNEVLEAIFDALFLRGSGSEDQLSLDLQLSEERLDTQWKAMADQEKRSRTVFAQEAMKPEEVRRELEESWAALGHYDDVARFVQDAAQRLGAPLTPDKGHFILKTSALPAPVVESCGLPATVRIGFNLPVPEKVTHISRTHPLVEALGSYLMGTALDGREEAPAARCGAIRTRAVGTRTTLLLLRLRYHLETTVAGKTTPLLVEDCSVAGFRGSPDAAEWLSEEEARLLLSAKPDSNTPQPVRQAWATTAIDGLDSVTPHIAEIARLRGEVVLESHRRVRDAAQMKGVTYRVTPILPADIIGVYVLMPLT